MLLPSNCLPLGSHNCRRRRAPLSTCAASLPEPRWSALRRAAPPLLCALVAAGSWFALAPPLPVPPSQSAIGVSPVAAAGSDWVRVADAAQQPVDETEPKQLSRGQLAKRFGLHARDARLLDPQPGDTASLLPRSRALLLRLRPASRLLVSADECWVPADDAAFRDALSARLAALKEGEVPPAHAGHAHPHSRFSFELSVLDAALDVECTRLESHAAELEREGRLALDALARSVSSKTLERVRRLKGGCAAARAAASGLRSELKRFLDDDSDLRSLQLSAHAQEQQHQLSQPQQHAAEDADVQPSEDVLETYFAFADSIHWRLHLLDESIDDMEAYVSRDLDAKRNVVMRINLALGAWTFADRLIGKAGEIGAAARPKNGEMEGSE